MNISLIVPGLLWVTIIPIVMKYRLLPVEKTPYWLFTLLFFCLILFTLLSINPDISIFRIKQFKKKPVSEYLNKIKIFIFICIVCIGVLFPIITAIADRHRVAPVFGVHDVLLQQEEAMKYLRIGKNPYKETYFRTFMEEFHYSEDGKDAVNPALYHFIMPPTYLLIPYAIAPLFSKTIGYFDGRMIYVLFLIILPIILYRWIHNKDIWMITVILLFIISMIFDHIIEGRSDLFAMGFLIIALYLLDNKKFLLSSIIFGLGIMTKQTIWFFVPFFIMFLWFKTRSIKQTLLFSVLASFIAISICVPFLIWDANAFFKSVILFPGGGTTPNYPISGYGIGMILISMSVIRDIHAYFPFIILQGIFGVPIFLFSFIYLKYRPNVERVFIGYGITLFTIWYTSRYFNNNHILFIAQMLLLGMMKQLDREANYMIKHTHQNVIKTASDSNPNVNMIT